MTTQAATVALLSAVSAVIDLGGCTDRSCTDRACWLGCLHGESRALVHMVLDELGVTDE